MYLKLGDCENGETFHDFTNDPILFVAGRTGSGKSNLLHFLLEQFLQNERYSNFGLVLIDCKRVEFLDYSELNNLIGNRVYPGTDILKCNVLDKLVASD
ncbi:hypothetical protein A2215_01530 [Candidatus Berkelbacteria bacterium RIFOXYA2_FULL_43_10]|uniref:FtsK domain-containing protein n=1 Tax=Candidatus Berkelbacteria bacterium RIFOXYA2_FULL_43_10 TaxID=1797472 RepID=A0A1F5E6U4_9BACT|nr:MAG: hypothetical protein A2215_01530 [Candidatus Berkelbacteria bacterium RIFOXYA2_FULL_43_10]